MTLLVKSLLDMTEKREVLSLFIKTSSASLLGFERNNPHLLAEQFGLCNNGYQVDIQSLEQGAHRATHGLFERVEVVRVVIWVAHSSRNFASGPAFKDEVGS